MERVPVLVSILRQKASTRAADDLGMTANTPPSNYRGILMQCVHKPHMDHAWMRMEACCTAALPQAASCKLMQSAKQPNGSQRQGGGQTARETRFPTHHLAAPV